MKNDSQSISLMEGALNTPANKEASLSRVSVRSVTLGTFSPVQVQIQGFYDHVAFDNKLFTSHSKDMKVRTLSSKLKVPQE